MEQHSINPPQALHAEPPPREHTPGDFASEPGTRDAREKITFWRDTALSNLELLRATYLTHAFAPHTHEGYAIGVIDHGAERFKYRRQVHTAPAGCLVAINPGETHTGEAAVQQGWSYRMLYPDVALLQKAASELTGNAHSVPFFPEPVIHDPALAQQFSHLHVVLANSPSSLERESVLLWTLTHLVQRYADTSGGIVMPKREYAPVQRVRAYLEEHYTQNISLDELAGLVNLSPFYLLRAFRETVGLPPHSYLTQIRVARARQLIGAAVPLAEVATAVGFSDQSHLHRHFKALVGVTPGQYARGHK